MRGKPQVSAGAKGQLAPMHTLSPGGRGQGEGAADDGIHVVRSLVGADPRVCPDLGGHTGPPLRVPDGLRAIPGIPPPSKAGPRGISVSRLSNMSAGFTIMEFIVVLVLVGIGLALTLGMLRDRNWRETYNLSNMASGVQSTLQMARIRAVARQGIQVGQWVPQGRLLKVRFMPATETALNSDPQMQTWRDLSLKPPRYGSNVFFALDHRLDATGKEVPGTDANTLDASKPHTVMWFYFNPDPYENGKVQYDLIVERDGVVKTKDDKDDPEYAVYFDPRGFATKEDGTKVPYVIKIKCQVEVGGTLQDRSEFWFQVTTLGKVAAIEKTGS